jgi:uncharacterized protein YbjT (DUF2867 family)
MKTGKKVLVFGATGNIGGAAARELLQRGWQVRAVTRSPNGKKAQALAALGAELIQADMDDSQSLEAAFDGMKRVLSVQNWTTSGIAGEVRQGKEVANAASAAQVEHLVFGSAGTGDADTGLPHFDSKLEVEAYMRKLDLPFSTIRPGPFMELMTQKEFYPAMGVWGAEPKVVGWDTLKPWVAVQDIGKAAANIFSDPDSWLGREIELYGDIKSLAQCRDAFVNITGKRPARIPIPVGLMRKMAGKELILMWQWIKKWSDEQGPQWFMEKVRTARELVPGLLDVESWLKLGVRADNHQPARNGSRAA